MLQFFFFFRNFSHLQFFFTLLLKKQHSIKLTDWNFSQKILTPYIKHTGWIFLAEMLIRVKSKNSILLNQKFPVKILVLPT